MFKFSMPECTLNITAEENLACESGELDKLAYVSDKQDAFKAKRYTNIKGIANKVTAHNGFVRKIRHMTQHKSIAVVSDGKKKIFLTG